MTEGTTQELGWSHCKNARNQPTLKNVAFVSGEIMQLGTLLTTSPIGIPTGMVEQTSVDPGVLAEGALFASEVETIGIEGVSLSSSKELEASQDDMIVAANLLNLVLSQLNPVVTKTDQSTLLTESGETADAVDMEQVKGNIKVIASYLSDSEPRPLTASQLVFESGPRIAQSVVTQASLISESTHGTEPSLGLEFEYGSTVLVDGSGPRRRQL